ncbi:hypothetical protein [Sapientia aquatica]|uniref:Uncharacterized protein n=1 Tax=Sapientia aquatica TaxID=1549640 RepID=A0A4R5VXA2_9BURK|nr:hypothetical protein [Sapientia aquatica]TDK63540.1 hypothetical protein E2I14_15175 [Sapientia aquatica]
MAILFIVLSGMLVLLVIAKIISDAYSAAELRELKEQWNDIKVGGTFNNVGLDFANRQLAKYNSDQLASCDVEIAKYQELKASQEKEKAELEVKAEEKAVADNAEMDKYEAARAKRASLPGVKLGMSEKQVINKTSWGAPTDVNTTITASGKREQWVYGEHGGYLYFTNGILTAIQN